MGMIDSIINDSFTKAGIGFLPADYPPEEIKKGLQEVYSSAQDKLEIVTGEAGSKLYNDPDTIEILRKLLARGVKIDFVFHKDDNFDQALENFKHQNKGLCDLKKEYDANFRIIWVPFRPKAHYHIIDEQKLILEKPHEPGKPKDYLILDDPTLAKEWSKKFEHYLSSEKSKKIEAKSL